MKRIFDIVCGSLLLIVCSPLLLVCALLVRISSPGPIIFAQWRCGVGETPFRMLKFRTMVANAEEWLESQPELLEKHRQNGFKLARREDPRVTRVGHFLRFSHMDELPQLLNVLKGDMSLIGPRPVERGQYGRWLEMDPRAREILTVKPGIFGSWTAQGRNRVEDFGRIQVEREYVRSYSMWGDFLIILRHIPVILRGQEEE